MDLFDNNIRYKKWIKYAGSISLATYVIGWVINTIYLSGFQVFPSQLINTRYLSTGIITSLFFLSLLGFPIYFITKNKTQSTLLKYIYGLLVTAITPISIFYIQETLIISYSSKQVYLFNYVCSLLIASILILGFLYKDKLEKEIKNKVSEYEKKHPETATIIVVFLIIFMIISYASGISMYTDKHSLEELYRYKINLVFLLTLYFTYYSFIFSLQMKKISNKYKKSYSYITFRYFIWVILFLFSYTDYMYRIFPYVDHGIGGGRFQKARIEIEGENHFNLNSVYIIDRDDNFTYFFEDTKNQAEVSAFKNSLIKRINYLEVCRDSKKCQ